ncbi:MAG: TlpA family protein disulfide reductase, partial [Bacteroidia bacterium]|nr:TlpA family protein disulfide reductase [Bacteroidia bacterium]
MRRVGLLIRGWGILFGVLIFVMNAATAQIRISEEIKPSEIVTTDSHKLYLIDFWATWCGPCISAKKYLEVLQKHYPEELYILSLTQETPDVVRKFLNKHKTGLAIAIDYDKENFTKHGIRSLPNSIMFSGNGELIWKGHPSDLSKSAIEGFLTGTNAEVRREEFIVLEAYKRVTENDFREPVPENEIEITAIENGPDILEFDTLKDFTTYTGNLISILAYLTGVSNQQVHLSPGVKNQFYKIAVKQGSRKEKNLVKHVMRQLKIRYEYNSVKGEALVLDSEHPNLWNTEQIDWGEDNPKYLIDDTQIQA